MSFRDQAIADLPAFTNVDEFGETISIDGTPMACVLVNDEASNNAQDGLSFLESTLYVKASDLPAKPEVRERMSIGDRLANVTRVDEEQGMLVIRLQWNES